MRLHSGVSVIDMDTAKVIYPKEGVLFDNRAHLADGCGKQGAIEYWLDNDDKQWLKHHPFIYNTCKVLDEVYFQRLDLNTPFIQASLLDASKPMRVYQWAMLDVMEVYIQAARDGLEGVCEKHIVNPKAYGLQFYDYHEAFFKTKTCKSLRECGDLLLNELASYLKAQFGQLLDALTLAYENEFVDNGEQGDGIDKGAD